MIGTAVDHLGSPGSSRLVVAVLAGAVNACVRLFTLPITRVGSPTLPCRAPGRAPGHFGSVYHRLRSPSRLRVVVDNAFLAVLAFVPMLASQPGVVTDDTKTYLYLDPGRYVRQAASAWDPGVGLGTVTHQNIGYLLPMGPFYWAMAELHVQLWVAQRLWMGCLLFAAGAGALALCRTIGLSGPGRYVSAIGFMFTPYVLQYAGRISVILLPWAGLPWLVAFVILALRRGGWRYPALFALVVALTSGINASSILYVGIAPALWLPYAVVVAREATWRKAWGVAWRVGLLSALVSLWWAVGLQMEAIYGVNVLKYTETVPATSGASLASEIVRGLGYWYFYGSDRVGAWTQAAVAYTQNVWLIGASFAVPALCFIAAAFSRWRHRAYFVLITVVGVVLSVGPNPYSDPSAFGSLIKAFLVDTTAGLALRSTDRASPLVILGLAMFLGGGVSALAARECGGPGSSSGASRWPPSPPPPHPCGPEPSSPPASPSPRPPRPTCARRRRRSTTPTRGPGSTPCRATISPPTGGGTPSTASIPA